MPRSSGFPRGAAVSTRGSAIAMSMASSCSGPFWPKVSGKCRDRRSPDAWRGLGLDQAQPLLDELNPAIHIFKPQLGRGIIDLNGRQITLERDHPGRQLAKPGHNTVEPL